MLRARHFDHLVFERLNDRAQQFSVGHDAGFERMDAQPSSPRKHDREGKRGQFLLALLRFDRNVQLARVLIVFGRLIFRCQLLQNRGRILRGRLLARRLWRLAASAVGQRQRGPAAAGNENQNNAASKARRVPCEPSLKKRSCLGACQTMQSARAAPAAARIHQLR